MSVGEFMPEHVPAQQVAATDSSADEAGANSAMPAGKRRRRLGPRSLTARLVTGVVGLVIVLVGAIGTSTYFSLRSFLADRLDQQLTTTAQGADGLFMGRAQDGPAPQDVFAVALDPDNGNVLSYPSGERIVALRLSAAERARIAARSTTAPVTVHTLDGFDIRMTVIPARVFGSDAPAIVAIGLSTGEEQRTLTRLVNLELLIGSVAVLLALLATSYGVRVSLRNLRRVTTTAQDVAAELSPTGAGLDRRVDVPDDGSEVGQLAESMNTLLSAVETQFAQRLESEQRLRQFLADASHELRTPLTSIRGYAELARMQRAAGADAEDNLARIESEGTRMSRLVEDLLTLARGDKEAESEPARELVDVGDLVEDAANDTRAAFPQRPIEVRPTPDVNVIGDRDQLLRAVRNLVTNAAVHSAAGRPILVQCRPDADAVLVEVIDGGPGLPPDEAAHVFERFWRADKARTRARGGSGLGLSIVATIVAAHGGTVRFDSSVEGGSTVTLRLPAVTVPS